MKYEKIDPIPRDQAEAVIRGGQPEDISLTLLRLAYHEHDWPWVQDICIKLSDHKDKWVRRACVTCFGHLARIHGKIDSKRIDPVLEKLSHDPEVTGYVEDTIQDLKIFLK